VTYGQTIESPIVQGEAERTTLYSRWGIRKYLTSSGPSI
jgi:hypothetical protein